MPLEQAWASNLVFLAPSIFVFRLPYLATLNWSCLRLKSSCSKTAWNDLVVSTLSWPIRSGREPGGAPYQEFL